MSSEIRVNKINNRAGLGTVTYTDTGIIVSGVSTASNFKTGTSDLHSAGLNVAYADVDDFVDVGNIIKLGNAGVVTATTFSTSNVDVTTDKIVVGTGVTIEANQVATGQATFTGIVTASSFRGDGSQLTGVTSVGGNTGVDFNDNVKVRLGTGNDLEIYYDGTDGWIKNVGKLKIESTNDQIEVRGDIIYLRNRAANQNYFYAANNAFVGLTYAGDMRLETESTGIKFRKRLDPETDSTVDLGTNAKRWRNIYADTYYGDGANLTNLPAGAPVGGASTNTVFFENDIAVAVNYQITTNKNAMSAGPISINAGIAVTVPSGSSWTIV